MKIKQIMFHHEIFLFDVALFNLIWVQIDKKVKWKLSLYFAIHTFLGSQSVII